MDKNKVFNGVVEYKMPKEMAAMYLKTAKGEFAKKHPKECKAALMDIDRRITASIRHWKQK